MGKQKLTTEDFIKEARKVHQHDNYIYEGFTKYINCPSPIKYYCKVKDKDGNEHGIQEQNANSHLRGTGCPKCGRESSINTRTRNLADIIEEFKKIHNNKYTYNIEGLDEKIPGKTKISITCAEPPTEKYKHGVFKQSINKHLSGQGCSDCGEIRAGLKRARTREDFIIKSNEVHNNKYKDGYGCLETFEHVKDEDNIYIICPTHGLFSQKAAYHIQGRGCQECGGTVKKTLEQVIEEANIIHNDKKYTYEKAVYIEANTKMIITCHELDEDGIEHGDFEQTPNSHVNRGRGCPKCCSNYPYTTETYIKKAQKIHDNYYSYDYLEYNSIHSKGTITCPIHGNFEQELNSHLQGCECPICGRIKSNITRTLTSEEFILLAIEVHSNKYNYDKVEYKKSKEHIIVICPSHGEFEITPDYHLHGGECVKCNPKKPWSKISIEWLTYIQETEAPDIEHYVNKGKEHRISNSNFDADGYRPSKHHVYEFHGCYYHGCPCKNRLLSEEKILKQNERYKYTVEREAFIRAQGYELTVMWECQWKEKRKELQLNKS